MSMQCKIYQTNGIDFVFVFPHLSHWNWNGFRVNSFASLKAKQNSTQIQTLHTKQKQFWLMRVTFIDDIDEIWFEFFWLLGGRGIKELLLLIKTHRYSSVHVLRQRKQILTWGLSHQPQTKGTVHISFFLLRVPPTQVCWRNIWTVPFQLFD